MAGVLVVVVVVFGAVVMEVVARVSVVVESVFGAQLGGGYG